MSICNFFKKKFSKKSKPSTLTTTTTMTDRSGRKRAADRTADDLTTNMLLMAALTDTDTKTGVRNLDDTSSRAHNTSYDEDSLNRYLDRHPNLTSNQTSSDDTYSGATGFSGGGGGYGGGGSGSSDYSSSSSDGGGGSSD